MNTVDYTSVLRQAVDRLGADYDELDQPTQLKFRGYIHSRLKKAWQYGLWPELMKVEQRWYRSIYDSSTAYAYQDEVFYPTTGKYYQAIRAVPGGNLPTDVSYWHESTQSYSANEWNVATNYVAGDTVFYTPTGKFYVNHTATVATLPTSTTKWGQLNAFNPYIADEQTGQTKIGTVIRVMDKNPNLYRNAVEQDWSRSENGTQVLYGPVSVWIEFRRKPNALTGASYSAAATYSTGDQVLYVDATTGVGNFYDCIYTPTPAGQTPPSSPLYWTKTEIPARFEGYLVQGAYADALRGDGQQDKAAFEGAVADGELADQLAQLEGPEQQIRRVEILTR